MTEYTSISVVSSVLSLDPVLRPRDMELEQVHESQCEMRLGAGTGIGGAPGTSSEKSLWAATAESQAQK